MKQLVKNNIDILIKNAKKTPRMTISLFFRTDKKEKYYGVNSLLSRLLIQGTKKYSASELAKEFENECIDISFKAKQDYIKATLVFLNEDFNKAIELTKELILNSTFDDFEKEVHKLKGEITSDLDNPRFKLTDCFVKNIFNNHPYSSCHTKILENLDKITKQDIIDAHKTMLNSKKAIVCVGDMENEDSVIQFLIDNFNFMQNLSPVQTEIEDIFKNDIEEDKIIFVEKNDAQQAQILQGWIIDSYNSKDYTKFALLNNILGSSGLSSRLFVNLRDKQGLAYTVRSQYETLLHSAIFNMYIGTNPINIEKSLNGFKDELQKLADVKPSEDELQGAKENILGRLKYFSQNNSQIASIEGYNYIMGLGLNYNEKFIEEINKVTSEDVSNCAKYLLSIPKLVVILAPKEYHI